MTREWKPGDVARIGYLDGEWNYGIRLDPKDWAVPGGTVRDGGSHNVRPLVVIDPEDREQVERLLTAILSHQPRELVTGDRNVWNGQFVDALTRALREFANPTPPKPPEPTGLGAVVVDEHGCKWVLYTHPDSTAPWTDGSTSSEWSDLDAVRVLSEGVTE